MDEFEYSFYEIDQNEKLTLAISDIMKHPDYLLTLYVLNFSEVT